MEEAETELKKKWSVSALSNLQDYKNAINHEPSKWEDLEYDQMSHKFWGGFYTYMGKHAMNKL